MTGRTIRFVSSIVAVTACSWLLSGPRDVAASTSCAMDEAVAWVDANIAHLPSSLDEIAKLELNHQKATLAKLPAATRAKVWRDHFAKVAAGATVSLTKEQLAELQFISARLEYILTSNDQGEQDALVARLRGVFDPSLMHQLFFSLGTAPTAFNTCECNWDANDCGTGQTGPISYCEHQMNPNLACSTTSFGCGFLWLHDCDGECNMQQ